MKFKKLFAAISVLFVMGTSAFAFDGETFWREYGAGLKDGDGLFSVGMALDAMAFPLWSTYPGAFYLPYVETSYEKMVHINDMLPFSFGGYGGGNILVHNTDEVNRFFTWIRMGALAKYHFNFDVENLDVYAGVKIGFDFEIWLEDNEMLKNHNLFNIDWNGLVGASWRCTDKLLFTAESGYPYLLALKLTFQN